MTIKQVSSNSTGLRIAEETSLQTLPTTPVWRPLDPNSYKDFGGKYTSVARSPISASRQRRKGTITDLDVTGGFNQDLTLSSTARLLQGFLFAAAHEKPKSTYWNGTTYPITAVSASAGTYAAASGLGSFLVNHLVLGKKFTNSANNGLHKLTAVSTTALTTTGLADETPSSDAELIAVGYEFASATLNVVLTNGLPYLTRASGSVDFTTLGLVAGEWIYVGGDTSATRFVSNVGFARVKSVSTSAILLDKTSWSPVAETGTGLTVRIFFGTVIHNEDAASDIVMKSYQIERTLGDDDDGTMSEYLLGAVPDELTLDVKDASKVSIDMTFAALSAEQRDGSTGVKPGTRPDLEEEEAFNTSSDFSRISIALVDDTTSYPSDLFAFATEISLSLKNNLDPIKAIGTLGGFDMSAGMLEVSGKITAYFADVAAIAAVKNNSDVTVDMILARDNEGLAIDVPLMTLGDGRLTVEQNKPITLALENNAVRSDTFGHTLLVSVFHYLPSAAC